jgi:hypothetical protein
MVVLASTLVLAQGAAAAVIHDEALNGDAPSGTFRATVVQPGVGTSTINGVATFAFQFTDYDSYLVRLPFGTALTGLTVAVGDPTGTGTFSEIRWILTSRPLNDNPGYDVYEFLSHGLPTSGPVAFTSGQPNFPVPFVISTYGYAGAVGSGQSVSAPYEITLNVAAVNIAPVPLPATLPLMVAALALLCRYRRISTRPR